MAGYDFTIQAADPFKAIAQGYQLGAGIRDDQQKQQVQQVALQQATQQKQLLSQLAMNPNATGNDYARVITQIPSLAEPLSKAWATRSAEQNQSLTSNLLQWGAAIKAGQPRVAADAMQAQADAMEQSAGGPTRESQALRANAQVVSTQPLLALGLIQAKLSANPNGKDAAATLASFGGEQRANEQAPADLLKKQADATTAAAQAGVAPQKEALGLANTQSQIQDREAGQRIAELNAQIAQANSETQRGNLILERDKLAATQGEKRTEQAAGAQDQLDAVRSSLQTVKAVSNHQGIENTFQYGGVGSMRGALEGMLPGTARTDLQGLVDTLKAQQFLTGIKQMQGMGALSNSEGDKIGAAVASLNLNQSPKAFKNALGVVQSTLERAEKKLIGSGKLSTTSPTFVANIPGFGVVDDGMVNRLLKQFPGSTRDQVTQFLQSQAKPASGATGGY